MHAPNPLRIYYTLRPIGVNEEADRRNGMDLQQSRIAIVGATGAVGVELLSILGSRGVPADNIVAMASPRSAGKRMTYLGGSVTVESLDVERFRGIDAALFSAGGSVSREIAPEAVARGAHVVDNSSAFRMDPDVPLVVPEVNPHAIRGGPGSPAIIANPNCSTIVMLMAVTPLHRAFGVERLVVSTYQAVSGAGAAAMDELEAQTRTMLQGGVPHSEVFSEPCAFNVFSHDSKVDPETGRNVEEEKLIRETRKIWEDSSVRISGTCVRVGVMRAHTESINVALSTPATEADVRAAIGGFDGVALVDDRAANDFPTPLKASGRDDVLVGRIRPDGGSDPDTVGRYDRFDLLCSGDQLRKGAALNAIQIAEILDPPNR